MGIVCDDCDERQTRVDRMIDEFRTAQSRRLAKATVVTADDQVVELPRECPRSSGGPQVKSYTDFTRE